MLVAVVIAAVVIAAVDIAAVVIAAEDFSVAASYLEVYNEGIYDLLEKGGGPLELREDADAGVCVAGLRRVQVSSPGEILGLLEEGNRRRKTDSTDANAASSRSHAVLDIQVTRAPRGGRRGAALSGRLTLVDLAGSERAAETHNGGQKLRDGASINRSLLALANCINALGKMARAGAAYVPYRNSKLTRLLKESLSGNSRTAMVATIGPGADQYPNTINTLKYADRAKEIRTHVVRNVGCVERHISDYQGLIDNLQAEVQALRAQVAGGAAAAPPAPAAPPPAAAPAPPPLPPEDPPEGGGLARLDALVSEAHEGVEERINLQKALLELQDAAVCAAYELANVDAALAAGGGGGPAERAAALEQRGLLAEEVAANAAEAARCREDIAANEAARRDVQARIAFMPPSYTSWFVAASP